MSKGRKFGGRKKGVPNKKTALVRAILIEAFEKVGGIKALVKWGKANPTDFYNIWVKLLPQQVRAELTGQGGGPIQHQHAHAHLVKVADLGLTLELRKEILSAIRLRKEADKQRKAQALAAPSPEGQLPSSEHGEDKSDASF